MGCTREPLYHQSDVITIMGCTCESTTKGLLEPVFLHAAASQADQLGPHGQHGLREGQVVHAEGYHRQLGARERETS